MMLGQILVDCGGGFGIRMWNEFCVGSGQEALIGPGGYCSDREVLTSGPHERSLRADSNETV